MSWRDHYNILNAEIISQGLTSAQVANITKNNVRQYIGLEENAHVWTAGGNINYWRTLRDNLVEAARARELRAARAMVRSWAEANPADVAQYPDAKITADDIRGRRVIIWLDGEPTDG